MKNLFKIFILFALSIPLALFMVPTKANAQSAPTTWAYQAILNSNGTTAYRRICQVTSPTDGLSNLGSGFSDGAPCKFLAGDTAESIDPSILTPFGGRLTSVGQTSYKFNNQWHTLQWIFGADGVLAYQRDCVFDPNSNPGSLGIGFSGNGCQFKGPYQVNDPRYGGKILSQSWAVWDKSDGTTWAYQAILNANGTSAYRRICQVTSPTDGLSNFGSGFSDGAPCKFIGGDTAENIDPTILAPFGGRLSYVGQTAYKFNNQWHTLQWIFGADGVLAYQRDCIFNPDTGNPGAIGIGFNGSGCQFKGPYQVNDARYGGKILSQSWAVWDKPAATSPSPSVSPSTSPTPSPTSSPEVGAPVAFSIADSDEIAQNAGVLDDPSRRVTWTGSGMSTPLIFFNDNEGAKTVFVKYFYASGAPIMKSAQIVYRKPIVDPILDSAACRIIPEGTDIKFNLTGVGFGSGGSLHLVGPSAPAGIDLPSVASDWSSTNITRFFHTPALPGQVYSVSVKRSDGKTSNALNCTVDSDVLTLSLGGAKLFCRAPSQTDANGVSLVLIDQSATASAFPPRKQRATVTIDSSGNAIVPGVLVLPNRNYIAAIKPPKGLRQITAPFTVPDATSGATVQVKNSAFGDLVLPVGDFNADGKINIPDLVAFKSYWTSRNQEGDLNRDQKVNSVDFACMRYDVQAVEPAEPD